jgi:hypothetical protein
MNSKGDEGSACTSKKKHLKLPSYYAPSPRVEASNVSSSEILHVARTFQSPEV